MRRAKRLHLVLEIGSVCSLSKLMSRSPTMTIMNLEKVVHHGGTEVTEIFQ
jgi:hypothetical protein